MHIAFEGPIGAGKTTLARAFADRIQAEVVLESFHSNPYLRDFYDDRERWALPMQLWFLSDRHRQLGALATLGPIPVVSDHTIDTDGIFAQLLLDGRSLELYRRISDRLSATLSQPDIVVLVDARDDILLSRIAQRGRPYEGRIGSDYLDALRRAYNERYPTSDAKVVRVDTSDLNLASKTELNKLFDTILAAVSARQ